VKYRNVERSRHLDQFSIVLKKRAVPVYLHAEYNGFGIALNFAETRLFIRVAKKYLLFGYSVNQEAPFSWLLVLGLLSAMSHELTC
jgi:hypothetical protein